MALTALEVRALAIKDIDIVGFEAGETISVKLKTLSLLGLVGSGKIPNILLSAAMEMFEGKSSHKKSEEENEDSKMADMAKLMDIICSNSLVEPSYEEVGDILTDEQKMEIFYYTQGGVKSLESFRKKSANNVAINNGESVQS